MKRNLIIAALVAFAFSSIFLLSSCAKKQVLTQENEIKAALTPQKLPEPEKERPTAKEALEKAQEEEIKSPEATETQVLEELETTKKREAEAKAKAEADEKAWLEKTAAKVEAESIYFDFDKSFIRQEYRSILHEKAQSLKDNPNLHVRIEGNCDERGTNEYNLALGERRAMSAKNFLVSLGISPDRIKTISYGEERPFSLGHDEDSWSQNRRDDFVVEKK